MEIDERLDAVVEAVYRDMQVYCIAANAGADLSGDMLIGSWTGGSGEWDGPGLVLPSGWAAWYAAAEELP